MHNNFWRECKNGQYIKCAGDVATLKTFNVKAPLNLLMAAYDRFPPQNFAKIIKWVAIISIRYNFICGKATSNQNTVYNKLANEIMADNTNLSSLKEGLLSIYPKDKEFVHAFSLKGVPSGWVGVKRVRHLLREIEKHLCQRENIPAKLTLEHVLPNRPKIEWQKYFGLDNYSDAINRLGNIALLSKSDNMAHETFTEKKRYFVKVPTKSIRISQNMMTGISKT